MSFVYTCMSSVSHSHVLVCHPCATLMYSHVIRMSLVCTRISPFCHSYVLLCHPYVTRYILRISLVCTRMSSVCRSYVVLPWASHSTLFLFFYLLFFFRMLQILVTLSKLKHMAACHGVTRLTNNNLVNISYRIFFSVCSVKLVWYTGHTCDISYQAKCGTTPMRVTLTSTSAWLILRNQSLVAYFTNHKLSNIFKNSNSVYN